LALAALIISLATFAWTVAWSVYEFRQRSRREVRVRAWLGEATHPRGREGDVLIDVSAVNTGMRPVTLRMANARIIGDRRFAVAGWLHQEPKPLGGRAVLHSGETWVGLLDANAFAIEVERAATTPPPWRVVFAVTDAGENRYEQPEEDALEFAVGDDQG
jgi:hypothetical protein